MRRRAVLAASGSLLSVAVAGCFETRLNERGSLEVIVDGEEVDLTARRFQSENADSANDSAAFHLHEGEEEWFMEGTERVTFAEAIDLLPHFAFEERDGGRVVTVDGTTYDDTDDGTTLEFLANGESADPTAYELHDGDELRLEIETDAE
ncbi:hypothetical protein ACFQGT_11560 [Natrialbaceae archaeon GCM10025810]|uniref:hypothetical protein n=1 Tax=Halovalidus salilacus TaxID=3075124 RepID=UPI003615BBC8